MAAEENTESTRAKPEPPKETSKERIQELAQEVLRGERGRGPDRKRSLGKNYEAVMKEVLKIRKGK